MSFDKFSLDPRINAAIAAAGFTSPTPIQEQALPTFWREKMSWAWPRPARARPPRSCCPSCNI